MNKIVSMDEIYPLIEEKLNQNGKVVFTPKGTSMFPTIVGDVDTVTLVKAKFPLAKYSIALYKRDNGKFILHRVVDVKDDCYVMRGDNQYSSESDIREDQIVGVVETYTSGDETKKAYGPENDEYAINRFKQIDKRKKQISIRRFFGNIKRKIIGAK